MKKIVCELCESMEFTKEGGVFICQGCGTKYSLEEAKSMMREVDGDSAPSAVGPAAAVSIPAGNPNQAQIDNLLVLATTAYEAQNYGEAENYCNRAIELDAMCYKAWNLKGKAVGWSSKMDNMRVEEAAHSFCKAIDFAPEEEKEGLKAQAVEELKNLGLAIIATRKKRFSGNPVKAELNGFTSDRQVLLNALLILLKHGNVVGMPEGYLESIAKMMAEAAGEAMLMAVKAWKGADHPSRKDFGTVLDWLGNCAELLQQAIDASDEDEEADKDRYELLISCMEAPMGWRSYKREWSSYQSEYIYVVDTSLTNEALELRRKQIAQYREKIAAIEISVEKKKQAAAKKAEEEKRQRIEAYWADHAEEKAALDSELKELKEKEAKLDREAEELNDQLKEAWREREGRGALETEADKLNDQIRELKNRRAKLGIFSGKEKRQIGEEITALEGRVLAMSDKIAEEKAAKQLEIEEKTAPLQAKWDERMEQLTAVKKRISEIQMTLTKDPE